VKTLVLTFDQVPSDFSCIPGVLNAQRNGRQAMLTVNSFSDATIECARLLKPSAVSVMDLALEDIFVSMVGGEARHE